MILETIAIDSFYRTKALFDKFVCFVDYWSLMDQLTIIFQTGYQNEWDLMQMVH